MNMNNDRQKECSLFSNRLEARDYKDI